MKKLLVLIFCAAVACFALAGCGESKFMGTWETKSMEENGEKFSADDEELGSVVRNFMVLFIDEDGKGTISSYGIESDITWELDGSDTIIIKENDEEMKGKLSGGELTIENNNTTIVLQKRSS